MTPVEIGAAIQTGKTALETLRKLAEWVNKSQNAAEALQMTATISDLGLAVNQMQFTIMQIAQERDELQRQLEAGSALAAFKARYRYEENVSWKYDESGKRIDGPFCPNCIDAGKECRLNPVTGWKDSYHCVVHKVGFRTSEAEEPPLSIATRPGTWAG